MTKQRKINKQPIEVSDTTSSGSDSGDGPAPNAIFVKGIFQFGRHSGKLIEEVFEEDPNYCKWYLKNINPTESKHKAYVVDKLTRLFEQSAEK